MFVWAVGSREQSINGSVVRTVMSCFVSGWVRPASDERKPLDKWVKLDSTSSRAGGFRRTTVTTSITELGRKRRPLGMKSPPVDHRSS